MTSNLRRQWSQNTTLFYVPLREKKSANSSMAQLFLSYMLLNFYFILPERHLRLLQIKAGFYYLSLWCVNKKQNISKINGLSLFLQLCNESLMFLHLFPPQRHWHLCSVPHNIVLCFIKSISDEACLRRVILFHPLCKFLCAFIGSHNFQLSSYILVSEVLKG